MSKSASWVYSTIPESEGQFLDDLESFLSLVEMDQDQFHYLTLSLSEAFTNAMVHGNKWDKSKSVMVQVSVNDMEVSADITDQGRGGLAAVMNRRRPELLAESGRGVDFMQRYCASVEFAESPGGGLTVRLRVPKRNGKVRVR